MTTKKKMVPCGNPSCNERRINWDRQDEMRSHQMCEVPEDYNGKAFCSFTCACYAGYFHMMKGWIKDPKDG